MRVEEIKRAFFNFYSKIILPFKNKIYKKIIDISYRIFRPVKDLAFFILNYLFLLLIRPFWRKFLYFWILFKYYGKRFLKKQIVPIILKLAVFFENKVVPIINLFLKKIYNIFYVLYPFCKFLMSKIMVPIFEFFIKIICKMCNVLKPFFNFVWLFVKLIFQSFVFLMEKFDVFMSRFLNMLKDSFYVILGFPFYFYQKVIKKQNNSSDSKNKKL